MDAMWNEKRDYYEWMCKPNTCDLCALLYGGVHIGSILEFLSLDAT